MGEYKRIKAPVKPHVDYDFEVLRERHTNLMAKKAKAAAEEETTKTVVSSKLQSGDDDLLRPINLQSWKYEGQQQDLSATTTTSTRKTTTTELDEDEQLLQPFVYERKTLKVEEDEESDGEYERRKLERLEKRKAQAKLQEEVEDTWTFSRKKRDYVEEKPKPRPTDYEYEELMRPFEASKKTRRRAASPPMSSSEEEDEYYSSRSQRKSRKSRTLTSEYESDYSTGVEFTSSRPLAEISWFKNNIEIFASSKYIITNHGGALQLEVTRCGPEDSATYSCRARNVAGEITDSARLDVTQA